MIITFKYLSSIDRFVHCLKNIKVTTLTALHTQVLRKTVYHIIS